METLNSISSQSTAKELEFQIGNLIRSFKTASFQTALNHTAVFREFNTETVRHTTRILFSELLGNVQEFQFDILIL